MRDREFCGIMQTHGSHLFWAGYWVKCRGINNVKVTGGQL